MVLTVGDDIGVVFRVQGALPNMVIYPKIAKKSGKNGRVVLTVGDDIGVVFRVQSTFPNMVIYPKIARK
jgi:hypothetical protein